MPRPAPPAPDLIAVTDFGLGGVNLVSNPLQMAENELTQAQNAEPYRDRGVAGIRKRPAWKGLNSALSAIRGLVPVELAQSGAGNQLGSDGVSNDIPVSAAKGLVLVARNTHPATQAWKYTVDGGTTWTTTTALSRNIGDTNHSAIVYKGRAFYAGEDDSIGQILCFDGKAEFEFCRLPFGPAAANVGGTAMNAIGIAGALFYFSLNDGTTGRVYAVDPNTGAATQVGGTFTATNEIVSDVAMFNGRVYLCTNNDNTKAAHIYSIKPEIDTTWTTERTTTDLGGSKFRGYNSLAVANGQLYAAGGAPAGFAALIERLDQTGTWNTELTSTDTTNDNYYDALVVWNGLLYGQYSSAAPAFTVVKQTAVGTWVTDKDMAAAGSTAGGYMLATHDLLFASAPPRVFVKSGTTWSTALSDANLTHGLLI